MGKVVVIGGGAAGMAAAIGAAQSGHSVTLYEKNEKLGKKIYITGKGRCNVTNACDTEELFGNVVTNGKFLYSAIYGFTTFDMMDLMEESGCHLKTERGNRVFPVSDKASDVIFALERKMKSLGVEIRLNEPVKELIVEDGAC
ncbi:MAG: NAD(P)/FAD-dependent oxidoreductase, partial [Lachnospiraceae bacterium]|nr:NAD(P)/FAD-dependent oxidoreductase [Lachnospiraceae bacterium]